MHVDAERLFRYADGALAPDDAEHVRSHVAECDACRVHVERTMEEWREIEARLGAIDHAPPAVVVTDIITPRGAARFPRLRVAAGIVLALAVAGAVYAVPAVILPRWFPEPASVEDEGTRNRSEGLPTTAPDTPQAGIAVQPGEALRLDVATTGSSGSLEVRRTDGAEVRVRAPIGAATFATEERRLLVTVAREGTTIEIEIPRTASRIEIRVDQRVVFRAADGSSDPAFDAEPDGTVRIPFAARRP
ncbi:MAG TPA: zf-HC2 domain-containing protein [Gemmatimonadaceae bacterium]|nr:zf-HC2 domain-containing protein [Gemmatimonadaceae bacterium]